MTSDITNVDLRFLRKARGVAPLSRYALSDDGSVVVALPDSMEVRTIHFARFDPAGKSRVEETYSVETLRKTDIGAGGGGIGITDDDLYLFRDARKSRFLPDRRASYADIALCASGGRFITGFSDMLASGHAIAWGDIGGRALWTKDIPFPVTRVAVDRQGATMAVVGETGDLLVLDSSRNTLVQFRHEMALRAVATIGARRTVFAGVGGVGAVDSDGRLVWFTELVGEPIDLAIDAEARTTAVLLKLDDTTGRLVFLSVDGLPTWEIDIDDSRPTGLSLSANGRFAATTLRDGSLSTYELYYGERVGATNGASVAVIEARTARDSGNFQMALHLLRARVVAQPDDVDTADAYRETLEELRTRCITSAENAEAVGDFAAADARLLVIVEENPFDAEAVARRAELRRRWSSEAHSLGQAALEAGNGSEAEIRFLEAIEADPLDRDSRIGLALARTSTTRAAIERGCARIASGDFAGAASVLAEVQTHGGNSPEVADLLRKARIGEAMTLGNTLYQDRQYAAALFQYKKALRLDPANTEARQRISYSQNFLQDTQLNDRFTRLE